MQIINLYPKNRRASRACSEASIYEIDFLYFFFIFFISDFLIDFVLMEV